MAPLPRAVVDLDPAGLGLVQDAGDEDGLPAGRDRELDRLGHGRARLCRLGHATADVDALEVDAEVGVDRRGLGDRLGAAEGHGDVVRRAATAVRRGGMMDDGRGEDACSVSL